MERTKPRCIKQRSDREREEPRRRLTSGSGHKSDRHERRQLINNTILVNSLATIRFCFQEALLSHGQKGGEREEVIINDPPLALSDNKMGTGRGQTKTTHNPAE